MSKKRESIVTRSQNKVQFEDHNYSHNNSEDVEVPKALKKEKLQPRGRSRSPARNSTPKKITRPKSSSRSRSRERVPKVKKVATATPSKSAIKSEVIPALRKSPRVRVSRVSLAEVDSDEDEDEEKKNDIPEVRSRRNLGFKMTPEKKFESPAKLAVFQTAKVAGLAAPELMELDGKIKKDLKKNEDFLKPIPVEMHFGGTFGALFLIVALPTFVFIINLICSTGFRLKWPFVSRRFENYVDFTAISIYLGWISFQAILYTLPLGRLVRGQTLRDGTYLQYRLNGFCAFLLSGVGLGVIIYYYNPVNLVFSKLNQIIATSIVFSFLMSLFLFVKSRWCPIYARSLHGNTGKFFYDFFMGRELNPSFLGFDLKMFFELRPGLIGWAALNVCFMCKDFQDHGSLSPNLAVSAICQILYVMDALYFEQTIISTMDITTEGLGLMLVFGNLSFVPFIFTIESRYLLNKHLVWPWYCLLPLVVLFVVGYFIFRLANSQKDEFRTNPHGSKVAHLKTIITNLPKKILAGGWWGWVRHPNYFGDLLMASSWCLTCGFDFLTPYTYLIYLFCILCHRAIRDDNFCHKKYGTAWETYQQLVRSRIFPKIF